MSTLARPRTSSAFASIGVSPTSIVTGQIGMLVVMVFYTMTGLYLLMGGI